MRIKRKNMKEPTIKLDNKDIPCRDVLSIRLVQVSDELFSEFTYRLFEPAFHTVKTLVPRDKAYKLELKVRKAMNRT